jgi:hypothetical protein
VACRKRNVESGKWKREEGTIFRLLPGIFDIVALCGKSRSLDYARSRGTIRDVQYADDE